MREYTKWQKFRSGAGAETGIAQWLVMALFLPWSAYVVPFLGVWYILYVANFLLYDRLNEAFRIEEQINRNFPEQIPVYDGE